MTPQQMFEFFGQQALRTQRGVEAATAAGNAALLALNYRQRFKAHVMQGLLAWRCGLGSPVAPFQEAVGAWRAGAMALAGGDLAELPLERASFIAFLIGEPPPPPATLTADRLLDAALAGELHGRVNDEDWQRGLTELQKIKGSDLAAETYQTYGQLLRAAPETRESLIAQATALFNKRGKNGFFSGGDQTEGGGPDNEFVTDYRLAAILKKLAYTGDSPHRWKWS